MATLILPSCLAIALTGAMLGSTAGVLIFAAVIAGKRADEWQPPPLPTVEKILAWARIEGDLEAAEQAIGEYEIAFGREMILAGEREREQEGATWALPCYAWRNAS